MRIGYGRAIIVLAVPLALLASPICCSRGAPDQNALEDPFADLPSHWAIVESFAASPDQLGAVQQKLGGRIARLSNTVLSVHGQRIQVNLIDCPTERDAIEIHRAVSAMKGDPAFCLRRDNRVIEFVGDSVQLAVKATLELGFAPKPAEARFRVSAELVPLDECDYMSFNELFNLLVRMRDAPGDEEAKSRIRELSSHFRFGRQIRLRTSPADGSGPVYRFLPKPTREHVGAHGETVTYTFEDMPDFLGVPYVSLVAEIKTRSDGMTPTTRDNADDFLAATEFWPVNDPEVIRLAREITRDRQDPEAKAEAILRWLAPGKNIRFGGPVQGSRWGVKRVLEQGYGQCWDFADCFVTLCRASGVPCRQVAGWLFGGSGHIWAEILVTGKSWQQVDPTGAGVMECGIYHIPYFTSDGGRMPILYTSIPEIELLTQ